MDVEKRRAQILNTLKQSHSPISGEALSKQLGVSRQIIVQDIAVLKASNCTILSTNRGYLLYPDTSGNTSRVFMVSHTTEQIRDELYCIVDCGGLVRNVIVHHEVYGSITADLNISSRRDVDSFVQKVETSNAIPLKTLCGDIHSHTVEADNEAILDDVGKQLDLHGYLIK
ncbi:MAG: transcription repressor NadR [Lachnotalea sp.]